MIRHIAVLTMKYHRITLGLLLLLGSLIGASEKVPDGVESWKVTRSEHVMYDGTKLVAYKRGGRRILVETLVKDAEGRYIPHTRSLRSPDGWVFTESDDDSDGRCETLLVFSVKGSSFEAFERSSDGEIVPVSAEKYAALVRSFASVPYPLGTGTNSQFRVPAFEDAPRK